MDDMFKVQVVAILDEAKSEKNIRRSLIQFSNSLSKTSATSFKIAGTLDFEKTLENLKNELNNTTISIPNIKLTVGKIDNKIQQSIENEINKTSGLISQKSIKINTNSSLDSIRTLQNKLNQSDLSVKNLQSSLSQLQIRSAGSANSAFQTELSAIQKKVSSITTEFNKLKNINLLNITDPDTLLQNVDRIRSFINNLQRASAQIKSLNNEQSAYNAQLNAAVQSQNLFFSKKQLSNEILTWMNDNTKAAKVYSEQLNQLRTKIETVPDARGLTSIRKEFMSIKAESSSSGLLGDTFTSVLMNDIKKISSIIGIGNIAIRTIYNVKEMFTNVKNLDSSMVELKKVTNETDSTYQTFFENSTVKAKELGVTITDLVDAASNFARLGYSLDDSTQLGEVATMYANVGDEIESVDAAAKSIISTIKAFDIDATDSISIIDKINEVSNNESISAGGLGEALQRSAAALATANNDLNESLALITAGNLVNQDPVSVGTGLKTVSLRIRGAKAELDKMGEDTEGMIESTSKLQTKIKALTNVDIIETNGETFKSTYQILKEISKVWNNLSDLNRATVLEDLFGKRQANIGASILSNFDVAEKTLQESLNSEGSAQKEYEKWLDSVEAKQARFQASFEALSGSVIDSDFMKGVIDAGTQVLNLITGINEGLGVIPTLLAAISSAWLTKNKMGKPDTIICVRWFNVNMLIAM